MADEAGSLALPTHLQARGRTIALPVDQHHMNQRWFSSYYQTYYTQKAAVKGANLNV